MKSAIGPQRSFVSLATKTQKVVREHEILRVAAVIPDELTAAPADVARDQVLAWTEKRSGGRLPKEAWGHQEFEHFSGGRNSLGARIVTNTADIWAIRAEDPDKHIPGRIWTTEVVVGTLQGQQPRFSVRLLASTHEDNLDIEPHVPGLVQQVITRCGLMRGNYALSDSPSEISSARDANLLCTRMTDPNRDFPLLVLSVPEDSDDQLTPLVDAESLSKATLGIAEVVVLPAEYTWIITETFGKQRSVFGGAARAYLPGFRDDSSPYDHRLILADQLKTVDGPVRCARWMRTLAASESIRRASLGKEVLAFSAIRNSSLQLKQTLLANEGASDVLQLEAAQLRISSLEKQIDDEKMSQEYFASEHSKAEQRAQAAEAQQRASAFRIQQLLDQIEGMGRATDTDIPLPDSWSDFANWCDVNLSGLVVLSPAARRSVRSPKFTDFRLAARCLLWLANDGRNSRLNGADRSLQDEPVEDGVRNAHCGNDAFDFSWQGNQYTADWHIKNGGNTRDPLRCLRIYYTWDPATRQIVVADMPQHRRTGAS
ncbi:hypothetical protein [Bradyrhizobium sp. HKCCYLR1023]|uniref:hypothetical protein n=1 Tax=Bradyrhizobium TaxID=374 RepID=UPI003EB6DE1B